MGPLFTVIIGVIAAAAISIPAGFIIGILGIPIYGLIQKSNRSGKGKVYYRARKGFPAAASRPPEKNGRVSGERG